MNRLQKTDRGSLEPGLVDLYLEFVAGASGAIPPTFVCNKGFAAVTLDSTGVITCNLQDAYIGLREYGGKVQQASFSTATGNRVELDPAGNGVASGTAPKVVLNVFGQDGTTKLFALANMAVGDVFRLHLCLQRLNS